MAKKEGLKTRKRRVWDDGWRLPDALWAKMEPLVPARPKHPLGCHNLRVPDRAAMDAIFFVLRTGCQWDALKETGICSSSSAHRRFQEWVAAGVFAAFWREGLLAYDALKGIEWTWRALDGAMGGGGSRFRRRSRWKSHWREGAAGWGEKPAAIPRIEASGASSDRC